MSFGAERHEVTGSDTAHFPCCGRQIVLVITERHNAGGRWQVANGKCSGEPWGARTRRVLARWRFVAYCGKEGARSMASGKWQVVVSEKANEAGPRLTRFCTYFQ